MKILVVDTYYPDFLRQFTALHPGLADLSYDERHAALMASHFAEADSYSHYLGKLGHEGREIIANADFLQQQWAREHGLRTRSGHEILVEQVKAEQPDVLYVQNIDWLDDCRLSGLRDHARLIVGQIASPLPPGRDFSGFDLIISSLPHYVRFFRNVGIPSEYLPLAFDPRVMETPEVLNASPTIPLVFVGGLSRSHSEGVHLLESVARNLPLQLWGYGTETLSSKSPLRRIHRGPAWALDMYAVLARSRVAINRHIDVAGPFAANLRLYEATGVGTCLVTDARDNLAELFEPDHEVVTYRTPEECVEKCRYLLDHEVERAAIAQAGQRRTLRQHTYAQRMQELAEILERFLRHPRKASRNVMMPSPRRGLLGRLEPGLKEIARQLPGKPLLRAAYHRWVRQGVPEHQVSHGHRVITPPDVTWELAQAWQSPDIAPKQRELVNSQLYQMYQGDVPKMFRVAMEAVNATGMQSGKVVEIGCASGYYFEALSHLLRHRVDYLGIDYSQALIQLARRCYPDVQFLVGDATRLPVGSESYDILLSGNVLLHVPDYTEAIRESARVARHWCIFHRTPVSLKGSTTYLTKLAYGVPVVEVVFGERELVGLLQKFNMVVERRILVDRSSIAGVAGEIDIVTYVCRKRHQQ